MNIIEAIRDDKLFRPWLTGESGGSLRSWSPWVTALAALYGLDASLKARTLQECTGRGVGTLPPEGFDTGLFLTGRRSGKSRIAACIAAYEAAISNRRNLLSPGEVPMVAVISPSRHQSRIVKSYVRSIFDDSPLLAGQIAKEQADGFTLLNGVRIEIATGHWATIRGYTLLAAIIDEAAFFGHEADNRVASDTELIRAIKPALATTGGKLVAISSPYAKRGWCFDQHERHFGKPDASTLVWRAPSRTMNPTLPKSVVEKALAEDLQAAKAEFLAEFREDVSAFVPRDVVLNCVKPGRTEIAPLPGQRYFAFCDISGGRHDDATLAIAHREDRTVVVDVLRTWRPPFSPRQVITAMAGVLDGYGLTRVTGDNYAGDFVSAGFREEQVRYQPASRNKSELYAELLPILCSEEVELPDNSILVNQLCGLERRTRSGGRDSIDHPRGQHDDAANAIAGVVSVVAGKQTVTHVGAF